MDALFGLAYTSSIASSSTNEPTASPTVNSHLETNSSANTTLSLSSSGLVTVQSPSHPNGTLTYINLNSARTSSSATSTSTTLTPSLGLNFSSSVTSPPLSATLNAAAIADSVNNSYMTFTEIGASLLSFVLALSVILCMLGTGMRQATRMKQADQQRLIQQEDSDEKATDSTLTDTDEDYIV